MKIKLVAAVDGHADRRVHDRRPDQERSGHRHPVGHHPRALAGLGRRRRPAVGLRARGPAHPLDRHAGEHVQGQALRDAAVRDRRPAGLEQAAVRQGGPDRRATTFDELLGDCRKLKAAGITPIGMGNKDGYFGAWFFSNYGKQNLDIVDQLKQAMIGKANIADPKYTGFYEAMHQLKSQGCLNDDIASLTLDQGMAKFGCGPGGDGLGDRRHRHQVGQASSVRTRWASPRTRSGAPGSSPTSTTPRSPRRRSSPPGRRTRRRPRSSSPGCTSRRTSTSWYETTGIFPADTSFSPSVHQGRPRQADVGARLLRGGGLARELPPAVGGRRRQPRRRTGDHERRQS